MGLALMVKQPPTTEATLEELSAVVAESNSTKVLRCPECTRPLLKDKFHPLIPVQIDRCPYYQGIWLDAGERSLLHQLFL